MTSLPSNNADVMVQPYVRIFTSVHRYTFRTRGQRAHLVVVAKAGKVYLTAGSTTEDRWADASDRLKAAVVSFRLV